MQAYRQSAAAGYSEHGSSGGGHQKMYRASSQQQAHHSSAVGLQSQHHGMQSQHHGVQSQHHGIQGQYHGMQGKHHALQGGNSSSSSMMHQQQSSASAAMMHKQQSSSMSSSQYSSSSSMNVFGQDAFCEIMPSAFPPGTDPKVIECYNRIDRDGNGIIDDMELQSVLSNCNHSFSTRTVHLLMFEFTHSNKRRIGPKEFVPLLKCLQTWRGMFQRFDRDRNGTIDSAELGQALTSLGYCVSPIIVHLLVSKFSKSGRSCSLRYDSFIECCLTVKGLTETFNAKADCGKATFCYEEFLLNVLPFIIA